MGQAERTFLPRVASAEHFQVLARICSPREQAAQKPWTMRGYYMSCLEGTSTLGSMMRQTFDGGREEVKEMKALVVVEQREPWVL